MSLSYNSQAYIYVNSQTQVSMHTENKYTRLYFEQIGNTIFYLLTGIFYLPDNIFMKELTYFLGITL